MTDATSIRLKDIINKGIAASFLLSGDILNRAEASRNQNTDARATLLYPVAARAVDALSNSASSKASDDESRLQQGNLQRVSALVTASLSATDSVMLSGGAGLFSGHPLLLSSDDTCRFDTMTLAPVPDQAGIHITAVHYGKDGTDGHTNTAKLSFHDTDSLTLTTTHLVSCMAAMSRPACSECNSKEAGHAVTM